MVLHRKRNEEREGGLAEAMTQLVGKRSCRCQHRENEAATAFLDGSDATSSWMAAALPSALGMALCHC